MSRKKTTELILPVDGTVLEVREIRPMKTFVMGDDSDPLRPISLRDIALAYDLGDYPDAEEGEHPDGFGVNQHKYSVEMSDHRPALEDGYVGVTVFTYCCNAMNNWIDDIKLALSSDTVVEIRERVDNDAEHRDLDNPDSRFRDGVQKHPGTAGSLE